MEFGELIKIIQKKWQLIAMVTVIITALGLRLGAYKSEGWEAVLGINITRSGKQNTSDYRFDQYYRLQADEKYSETVASWLKNPQMAQNILEDAGLKADRVSSSGLSNYFVSQRKSAQFIEARYRSLDEKQAEEIALSVGKNLRDKNLELNSEQKEENWFEIMVEKPRVAPAGFNWKIYFLLPVLLGLFSGIWIAAVLRYWDKPQNNN